MVATLINDDIARCRGEFNAQRDRRALIVSIIAIGIALAHAIDGNLAAGAVGTHIETHAIGQIDGNRAAGRFDFNKNGGKISFAPIAINVDNHCAAGAFCVDILQARGHTINFKRDCAAGAGGIDTLKRGKIASLAKCDAYIAAVRFGFERFLNLTSLTPSRPMIWSPLRLSTI